MCCCPLIRLSDMNTTPNPVALTIPGLQSVINRREVGCHMLLWLVLFGMWWSLFAFDFHDPVVLARFVFFLLVQQMVTTYLSVYYLIPVLLYPKQYVRFGIAYLGLLLAMGLLNTQWFGYMLRDVPGLADDYTRPDSVIVYGVMMNLFVNSLGGIARIGYDRLQSENRTTELEREKAELEKEKAEAELRFLKAQINPHFLFNSLNSIFNLIPDDPAQARELLVVFSEMLRYQLYETDAQQVSVTTELDYIRQYTRIEQVRKGHALTVMTTVAEPPGYVAVPPLILLTFVENAFKHVSTHTDGSNWVTISLAFNPDGLRFEVSNSKAAPPVVPVLVTAARSGGIGLSNVRRRLSLMYPGRHMLYIDNQPQTYMVCLTLNTND
jgi:two-component system, LytTR family, sensor kinase